MNNRTRELSFFKFLSKEGTLDRWVHNAERSQSDINDFLLRTPYSSWITSAFMWDDMDWADIHLRWINYKEPKLLLSINIRIL
jgi:hypothetical protein